MSGRTGWQKIARRIRVPLGFVFAAVFLWLARPNWRTMAASLVLVLPGLWLRGYASGYVKKNAELTMTGLYAHTRNPLYLGSMLIAFGLRGGLAVGDTGGAGGTVCGDLYPDDSERGGIPARPLCGIRCVCARGAATVATVDGRRRGSRMAARQAGAPAEAGFQARFTGSTASTIRLWARLPSTWRWPPGCWKPRALTRRHLFLVRVEDC